MNSMQEVIVRSTSLFPSAQVLVWRVLEAALRSVATVNAGDWNSLSKGVLSGNSANEIPANWASSSVSVYPVITPQ